MLTSHFLELLNGVFFVLTLCALGVFGYFIGRRSVEGRWNSLAVAAARALATFFLGEAIIRGWVWYWRHQLNDGIDVNWMQSYPVLALGGIIAAVGLVCVIRVFTPVRGCNWPWIASVIIALLAAGFFAFD